MQYASCIHSRLILVFSYCYSVPSQLSVSTVLLNGPEDDKATIRVLWTVSISFLIEVKFLCMSVHVVSVKRIRRTTTNSNLLIT